MPAPFSPGLSMQAGPRKSTAVPHTYMYLDLTTAPFARGGEQAADGRPAALHSADSRGGDVAAHRPSKWPIFLDLMGGWWHVSTGAWQITE